MYKISVLISGQGSTLDNLAFHCYDEYDGMIRGFVGISQVVADRECAGKQIAEKWGLLFTVIKQSNFPDTRSWSEALFNYDVDLHVMGGFLSRVVVPEHLKGRILNIHPSLLPAYGGQGMYGMKVHEAVVNNKEKITGCTVHVVDDEYDHGEIITREAVAVLQNETAADVQEHVQAREKLTYPRAILNYLRKQKNT